MANKETSIIVHTTSTLGAMQAQASVEKKYGDLKNFAIVYVSPKSMQKYEVCFQYDD